MTYYSPGIEYLCPRCNSNLIRFIFDDNFRNIWHVEELIRKKHVSLSEDIQDYYNNKNAPKWLCYGCYNCGVVLF